MDILQHISDLVQAGAASKFLYFLENRNFGIGIPKLIRLTIGRPKEDIHMYKLQKQKDK